jgi:hypothetical protein
MAMETFEAGALSAHCPFNPSLAQSTTARPRFVQECVSEFGYVGDAKK